MARILVVDDDPRLRDSLRRALVRLGHDVTEAGSLDEALERLATPVDLLVTDIRLGSGTGLDLIAQARRDGLADRIVAMTGFGSISVAVDAMRLGADDFIEKPFRLDAVSARLTKVLTSARLEGEVARLQRVNEYLRDELETDVGQASLVGGSAPMRHVQSLIARVAASDAGVLIQGESGTGKELAAREIHRLSPRAKLPFVACDLNSLSEGVIESELFGHEKGAFTSADRRRIGRFELADTGTLFLDEIGELAPAVQVKLLRVLQERAFVRVGGTDTIRVDVRVVAATNRDLGSAVQEGRFRSDLFYRLNVVGLLMPPLRERPDDIPLLAELFVDRYGRRPNGQRVRLAPETVTALQAYPWPGNVRQLENVIHRGCVLCQGDVIVPEDVALELRPGSAPASNGDLRGALAALERDLIARAIREHHGNLAAAGRALGIERNLLYYKLRKYGFRS
ncbi:MAG: sigma-54 dependent transcriptional regulator [Acidobacteriota bacterium]